MAPIKLTAGPDIRRAAVFSDCGQYRYLLVRQWLSGGPTPGPAGSTPSCLRGDRRHRPRPPCSTTSPHKEEPTAHDRIHRAGAEELLPPRCESCSASHRGVRCTPAWLRTTSAPSRS
ncbi:hypothetical protein GCM10009574_078890 [Streptomyces asiaticus]|uniref:Transposase n=2 Tax=Streptomyces rhizosphaericus TaxID=114699 RepID=A0ABP3ZDA8_9ACTN